MGICDLRKNVFLHFFLTIFGNLGIRLVGWILAINQKQGSKFIAVHHVLQQKQQLSTIAA